MKSRRLRRAFAALSFAAPMIVFGPAQAADHARLQPPPGQSLRRALRPRGITGRAAQLGGVGRSLPKIRRRGH
jgi:hypothetical protein